MHGNPAWLLIVLLLAGCMTVAEKEAIEALPMYGQPELVRSDYLQREDAAFIRQISYRYRGDLTRAGREWSQQAFDLLGLGDADGAMRRLNQAWLLNPDNYQVYWGFAQVLVVREQPAEALPHLQKALAILDDPYPKPALLGDLGTVYSLLGERAGSGEATTLFAAANARFAEAVALDDRFAPIWQRWAWSLYRQGDYAAAWETIRQARQLGVDRFSRDFIQTLSARFPEPVH
ncbi:tetratricopeptide repeat protein [Sedimenticola hydrogenitrophicus]|uniref:tetratricopeptide repeat protein n=1 Tax=Sedimenticola hydrogenitrophicus TaxID=2967975 RepID=UPI0021A3FF93|nr:tetratricopeptide repeat protein [Sedimenticola hydrogenitrophicus]